MRTAAAAQGARPQLPAGGAAADAGGVRHRALEPDRRPAHPARRRRRPLRIRRHPADAHQPPRPGRAGLHHHLDAWHHRSEEHTSELQSLMRISYAVFSLKKKKTQAIYRASLELRRATITI